MVSSLYETASETLFPLLSAPVGNNCGWVHHYDGQFGLIGTINLYLNRHLRPLRPLAHRVITLCASGLKGLKYLFRYKFIVLFIINCCICFKDDGIYPLMKTAKHFFRILTAHILSIELNHII